MSRVNWFTGGYVDSATFIEHHPVLDVNDVTRLLTDHGLVDDGNWIDDESDQDSVWKIAYKVESDHEMGYDWQWNTNELLGWLGY